MSPAVLAVARSFPLCGRHRVCWPYAAVTRAEIDWNVDAECSLVVAARSGQLHCSLLSTRGILWQRTHEVEVLYQWASQEVVVSSKVVMCRNHSSFPVLTCKQCNSANLPRTLR